MSADIELWPYPGLSWYSGNGYLGSLRPCGQRGDVDLEHQTACPRCSGGNAVTSEALWGSSSAGFGMLRG